MDLHYGGYVELWEENDFLINDRFILLLLVWFKGFLFHYTQTKLVLKVLSCIRELLEHCTKINKGDRDVPLLVLGHTINSVIFNFSPY